MPEIDPRQPPPGEAPVARDIAPAERLRDIRRGVAQIPERLHLGRMIAEERSGQGALSAQELRLAQAFRRLFELRPDIGQEDGVTAAQFTQLCDSDLALGQLGRALLQLEANAVIGATLLDARRTETDRLLLLAEGAEGGALSPRERDALRSHLAQVDLLYEAELQKASARRQSRDRQDAERDRLLQGARDEADRLRRRDNLRKGLLGE